VTKSLY